MLEQCTEVDEWPLIARYDKWTFTKNTHAIHIFYFITVLYIPLFMLSKCLSNIHTFSK